MGLEIEKQGPPRAQVNLFTAWINEQLSRLNVHRPSPKRDVKGASEDFLSDKVKSWNEQSRPVAVVKDIFQNLRDGHVIFQLVQALTGRKLEPLPGSQFSSYLRVYNIHSALYSLEVNGGVKLQANGITASLLASGDPTPTLDFMWLLMSHDRFRYGPEPVSEPKLTAWCDEIAQALDGSRIVDFKSDPTQWGWLFLAVLRHYGVKDVPVWVPNDLPGEWLAVEAFRLAEKELSIPSPLNDKEVDEGHFLDERSALAYLHQLHTVLENQPPPPELPKSGLVFIGYLWIYFVLFVLLLSAVDFLLEMSSDASTALRVRVPVDGTVFFLMRTFNFSLFRTSLFSEAEAEQKLPV